MEGIPVFLFRVYMNALNKGHYLAANYKNGEAINVLFSFCFIVLQLHFKTIYFPSILLV